MYGVDANDCFVISRAGRTWKYDGWTVLPSCLQESELTSPFAVLYPFQNFSSNWDVWGVALFIKKRNLERMQRKVWTFHLHTLVRQSAISVNMRSVSSPSMLIPPRAFMDLVCYAIGTHFEFSQNFGWLHPDWISISEQYQPYYFQSRCSALQILWSTGCVEMKGTHSIVLRAYRLSWWSLFRLIYSILLPKETAFRRWVVMWILVSKVVVICWSKTWAALSWPMSNIPCFLKTIP